MQPKQITRTSSDEITFVWDDGRKSTFTTDFLRGHCPCATCLHEREENRRQGLFSLPLAHQTEVRSLELSGRNAIIITWGDGHKTGIYTWEYLKSLESVR